MGTRIYYNIQKLRLFKGYSQEAFAAQLQLSTAHYGKTERGKFIQILKTLNAKPEIILGSALFYSNFKE